ncbi:DUF6392 family protein [Pseudomonas viridiflava]|uniref:DUF6392 family protein n=1 Tax=Pseudomonas viridiflava TaxID=33069 RepID=UPI0013CEF8E8|nr:DUF6392 family protein [Pseudomonas viridiflava]
MLPDSTTIGLLIKNLGSQFASMVAKGLLPDTPPQELYDTDSVDIEPVPGLELSFDPATHRFQSIHVTRCADSETAVYRGTLPEPYGDLTTRAEVRHALGEPYKSYGAMTFDDVIPKKIGGWDFYETDKSLHNDSLMEIQYTVNLIIEKMIFSVESV